MAETIREHLKRRAQLSLQSVMAGVGLMFLALWLEEFIDWAGVLMIVVFVVSALASIAAAGGMRCPGCGRWFSRGEYAAFTWPFFKEPESCPRCGQSYDAPWRKWRKSR